MNSQEALKILNKAFYHMRHHTERDGILDLILGLAAPVMAEEVSKAEGERGRTLCSVEFVGDV